MHHAEPDVVIVGAGIAGGALGTVLARSGFEVALLERESSYPDRVRGEFMAPWGAERLPAEAFLPETIDRLLAS